jgi:hypothetical protein
MAISRRSFFCAAGSLYCSKTPTSRESWDVQRFSPAVANAARARAIEVINLMTPGPNWRAAVIAGAHATAEPLFSHFEETRFTDVLGKWLLSTRGTTDGRSKWAALMDAYGVNGCSAESMADILPAALAAGPEVPRRTWPEIQSLLLRGLETGLTIDQRKFVRVTHDQRVLSIPIARAHWRFREEVELLQAASRQAVELVVKSPLRPPALPQQAKQEGITPVEDLATLGAAAVLAIAIATFQITLHQKNWFETLGAAGTERYFRVLAEPGRRAHHDVPARHRRSYGFKPSAIQL